MLALVLFAWIGVSRALDPAAVAIDRAHAAAVRKDRAGASEILRQALDANNARATRARLAEALAQVTRVFFTDQGQRAFETGQTALFDAPPAALPALREAARLEDGNVAVRLGLGRLYLIQRDCAAAAVEINEARRLNPLDGEAAALESRLKVCDPVATTTRTQPRSLPPLTKWQSGFVAYVQGRDQLRQGLNRRAVETLGRVVTEFPRFPEAHYFLGRAEGTGGEEHLRRYVTLCNGFTGRERREFSLEPRSCVHVKEAADDLAKKSITE